MSDWIKSFIVACLTFLILVIVGIIIGGVLWALMRTHPLIIPIIIIVGVLGGLTIIIHDKAKPRENNS